MSDGYGSLADKWREGGGSTGPELALHYIIMAPGLACIQPPSGPPPPGAPLGYLINRSADAPGHRLIKRDGCDAACLLTAFNWSICGGGALSRNRPNETFLIGFHTEFA